ncbi:hypothetical protein NIES4101_37530 [Calothrix sp. NIES-4101]|nr:hypothetical protein NIES4101_37530 [Calothrix sp. NIES-4101]
MTKKRTVICSFIAITSGIFAGFAGWQITMHFRSQHCQNQILGVKELCNITVIPGAMWQGSIAGLWTGTILGAFVGGLVTRHKYH